MDVHAALSGIAAHGLVGSRAVLPQRPLKQSDWEALVREVIRQRLQGMLAEVVATGELPVTVRQRRDVDQLKLEATVQLLLLERELLRVDRLLERAGVDFRVLKGAALARLIYPDPGLRVYGDIDVLVRTDHFDAAIASLRQAGSRNRDPVLRQDFARRFGKGTTLTSPDGVEVDIQRTFVMGPHGLRIELDDLFDSPRPFRLGGRVLQTLPMEPLVLHACYTVALTDSPPGLLALRDLAELALREDLDVDRILKLAAKWDGRGAVARALSLTWRTFQLADVVPLSAWADHYVPSRAERRALDACGLARFAPTARATLRALPGVAEKGAFLRAIALPDRAFLEHQQLGYARWILRGARASFMSGPPKR